MKLLYQTRSKYHHKLAVYEDSEGKRYLKTNDRIEIHSMYDPEVILLEPLEEHYWNFVNVFPLLTDVKRILLLGLGAGTMVSQLKEFFPSITIDGVEIDDQIIDIAEKYFGLDTSQVNIYNMDAQAFLEGCSHKYDIIVLDTFENGNLVIDFLGKTFFSLCLSRLRTDGIFVANYIDESPVNTLIKRAMVQSFEHVWRMNLEGTYNYLIFGCSETFKFGQMSPKKELVGLKKTFMRNIEKVL